jgi:hypothetical protein
MCNFAVECLVTHGIYRHFRELQEYDFPKVDVRTLTEFLDIVRTL